MTSPTFDISVVVCAYTEDRWNDLMTAVDALHRQTVPPREIVVVIDHNPSLLVRARAELSDVVILENREERGLSGARNCGIAATHSDIIAFVDEDAVAVPTWLEWLRTGYEDQRVLGVGGSIEPLWQYERPKWMPAEFDWVVGCTYLGMPIRTSAVRNLIGCNMSLRRIVFEMIGGFRSGIGRVGSRPVGCEETELCIRALQRWPQHIFLYEPQARVQHRVPTSRTRWTYFRSRCYSEGLSKALVARLVGTKHGLASERTYAVRTLPQGVLRGIQDGFVHGDLSGLARAGAIVTGLVVTSSGYVAGRLASSRVLPASSIIPPPIGEV